MSRLFLHIGYPKVGSSALQTSLFAARRSLWDEGAFFPNVEAGLCNAFVARFGGDPAQLHPYSATGDEDARDAAVRRDVKRLFHRLETNRCDRTIVSSESLIGSDDAAVTAIRHWAMNHFAETSIVCYIRDPVSYATSLTQERIKQGMGLTEALSFTPTGNFAVSIGRWATIFGKSNVTVRSIRHLPGADVVADFFGLIGCDVPQDRPGYANPAMSEEATRLIGAIHDLCGSDGTRRTAPSWLRDLPGAPFRLPEDMIERIRVEAGAGLAYLAAEWNITFDPRLDDPAPRTLFDTRTLGFLAERLAEG